MKISYTDRVVCCRCGQAMPAQLSVDVTRSYDSSKQHMCMYCKNKVEYFDKYHLCKYCGKVHQDTTICNQFSSGDIKQEEAINVGGSAIGSNSSYSRNIKGEAKYSNGAIKDITEVQTEVPLPAYIKEELRSFYKTSNKTFHNFYSRKRVHYEGAIKFNNTKVAEYFRSMLSGCNAGNNTQTAVNYGFYNKYNRYLFDSVDDNGRIMFRHYDNRGNLVVSSEKLGKVDAGVNKKYTNITLQCEHRSALSQPLSAQDYDISKGYKYVLSNDLKHKYDAFKLNEKVGSCQKSHNSTSYAKGAYDAITNGCNCPILIYKGSELVGRITARLFYNDKGEEYIMIERLYQRGEFGNNTVKGIVYRNIIDDLKSQGVKVIASNFSAHDASTLRYYNTLVGNKPLSSYKTVENLYQPLRRLLYSECGYYSDGGHDTYIGKRNDIDYATDRLSVGYIL